MKEKEVHIEGSKRKKRIKNPIKRWKKERETKCFEMREKKGNIMNREKRFISTNKSISCLFDIYI